MDKDFKIFKIKHNNIAPKKGKILIAEPFLQGMYFKRSIILLLEHSETGSMGFVLNKEINYNLNDIVKSFPKFTSTVFLGGPVDKNRLFYIHSLGKTLPKSIHIKDKLYWGGDFNILCNLIKKNLVSPQDIRFFVGYAGWSAGQLKDEINNNSWLVSDFNTKISLQENNPDIWKEYMENLGEKYKLWTMFPENPNLN